MTEFINAIDDYTISLLSDYKLKTYGFCELMRKTADNQDQVIPVTIPKREQVAIDDRYKVITWMRWAAPVSYETSDEWTFGKEEKRVGTIPIRLIFCNKTELGENLVFDFINELPEKFTISGYQFVFVNGNIGVDPSHEEIHNTELSNVTYERHRSTWNIYAITINVQFLQCES